MPVRSAGGMNAAPTLLNGSPLHLSSMASNDTTAEADSQGGPSRYRSRPKQSRAPNNKINACDGCRAAKLRCIDKETPPCERCRAFKLECTFARRAENESSRSLKRRLAEVEDQLRVLDRTVTTIGARPPQNSSEPGLSKRPSISDVSTTHTMAAPPVESTSAPSPATSRLGRPSFDLGQSKAVSPYTMTFQDPSPSDDYPSPEKESPIPTDPRFMNHLRDPLFAAAIGQPSRLNVPDSPKTVDGPPLAQESRGLNDNIPVPSGVAGGSTLPRLQDAVELGLCTLQEAERLYKAFFDKSHLFLPIYDPITDSFASIRRRSVMSLNAILLVAKTAEDTGKEPSWLFSRLLEQAGVAIIGALLNPVKHIETLQALTLLACWIDSGWKIGALAVSIGMDMEIHSCLSWLDRRNMAREKKLDQVQNERQAVVGARLWLALFKLRYEYAFNLGRPLASDADELLAVGRRFVEHPLATLGDCRLVASCELLRARLGLFRPYGSHDARSESEIEDTIRTALTEIGSLLDHWHGYYANCGIAELHTVRELLASEHAHAVLHTAAGSLSVTRFDEEILSFPEEKLGWLQLALLAAQQLVHRCLTQPLGQLYAYWTHEQRVGLLFAAVYMVRLAKILPEAGYNDQIPRETEELAIKTSTGPGRALGAILHKVLNQARNVSTVPPSAQLAPNYDTNAQMSYTQSPGDGQMQQSTRTGTDGANVAGTVEDPNMWFEDLYSSLVPHDPALASVFTTLPEGVAPPHGSETGYATAFPSFESHESPFAGFMTRGRG